MDDWSRPTEPVVRGWVLRVLPAVVSVKVTLPVGEKGPNPPTVAARPYWPLTLPVEVRTIEEG
jgi:hypothetical protein